MRRRSGAVPAGVVVGIVLAGVVLGGCSDDGGSSASAQPPSAVAPAAGAPLTVVDPADPVTSAAATSRALFASSGVAVVARSGDAAGSLLGASAAVALGVPMLLRSPSGAPTATRAELDRLGVRAVLAVGDAAGAGLAPAAGKGPGRRVVAVPASPRAVADAAGVRLGAARTVPADGAVAAVAALSAHPVALVPAGGPPTAAAAPTGAGTLPPVRRSPAATGTLVLTTGGPEALAGVASARAAGAAVQLTGGSADPRAAAPVVTALTRSKPRSVIALGAPFAGDDGLPWQLATATSGQQLPGGGQLLFPGRSLVALYGSPGSPALGVLGEQDVSASVTRARQTAAAFDRLLPGPVVPAFELIATVASDAPGPDGNYSTELDPGVLRPWVEAASREGLYVVLDLQPGRSDFLAQAQRYQSLLEQPGVGLALDPEWRLGPGQQPLEQVGSVQVEEINRVVGWLADLTRARSLPQKLLAVHQFRLSMISGRDRLDTSRSELAVMIHADGQGSQGDKQGTWQALHGDLPPGPLAWGWKNFIDEDHPMLSPEQTVDQVRPTPQLVTYQ